jgi:protein SCO1
MDWILRLPALNATLNATAALLLLRGYYQIREGRRGQHRRTMLAAFGVSVVFLISYLVYHFNVGSKRFEHEGMLRNVYISILLSHTVLAALVPFLAVVTLRRGLKNDLRRHARLARWTFPIWLYVSVTGVVVYFMLYWM